MHFRPYFTEWGRDVDKFLASYFKKREREARRLTPIGEELTRDILNFIKGGKRLRAGLVKLGYELAGGKNPREILPVAAAVEVLHGAFLIHDDIIDKSEFRHGRPTVHIKYSSKLKAQSEASHYGESMGIIAGDIGFFEAYRLVIQSGLSPVVKEKVLSEMIKVSLDTGFGEALDVDLSNSPKITENEVLKIHKIKTAFYTFIGPLTYGVLVSSLARSHLANLTRGIEEYGLLIGIAFQLQDDILGMFGDEKTLGKPVDSDIKEGKNTLLYLEALKQGTNRQKRFLNKVWGNINITNKELEQTRRIIKKTGAFEYSIKMARELVEQGKKTIPKLVKNLPAQEQAGYSGILSTLADYIIERKR